jgi:hypothetical protein
VPRQLLAWAASRVAQSRTTSCLFPRGTTRLHLTAPDSGTRSPAWRPICSDEHLAIRERNHERICMESGSSHVTGMIAALDARGRMGRRRSILPTVSDRDLGPRADPGWMPAGPNSRLTTTHSGPLGADAPRGPRSERPGVRKICSARHPCRELKSRDGEGGLPSRARGDARDQVLSTCEDNWCQFYFPREKSIGVLFSEGK